MWTLSQRKYAKSIKGIEARKRFQQSDKGRALRAKYIAIRKAKRLEEKGSKTHENKITKNKANVNKIVNKNNDKLLNN